MGYPAAFAHRRSAPAVTVRGRVCSAGEGLSHPTFPLSQLAFRVWHDADSVLADPPRSRHVRPVPRSPRRNPTPEDVLTFP